LLLPPQSSNSTPRSKTGARWPWPLQFTPAFARDRKALKRLKAPGVGRDDAVGKLRAYWSRLGFRSLSCAQIPGHISDDDMPIALDVELDLQQRRALVVQKVVEPPPLHQLRKHHRDQPIWVDTLKVKDVLDNRTGDETIRRGQHDQLRRSEAPFLQRDAQ
jgi:hypothetical protein